MFKIVSKLSGLLAHCILYKNNKCSFNTIFSLTRGKLGLGGKTVMVSNLGVRIIGGDKGFYHNFMSENGVRIVYKKYDRIRLLVRYR